uniref:Uncharacterized protein n=1 Tax=Oryza barthii TaxID=65489 RepID=A0A0D3H4I7_9ORYZ
MPLPPWRLEELHRVVELEERKAVATMKRETAEQGRGRDTENEHAEDMRRERKGNSVEQYKKVGPLS